MSLKSLMQDLADRLGVTNLTPDEQGRYALTFDDRIDVEVHLLDRTTVLFQAEIGREPDDEWAATAYFERVLTGSVIHLHRGKETVCLDFDTRRVLLNRMEQLDSLSNRRIEDVLEQFTNRAEEWMIFLAEDHHPIDSTFMPVPLLMP